VIDWGPQGVSRRAGDRLPAPFRNFPNRPVPLEADLRHRLSLVRSRIARAAESVQRDPAAVRLVAVSKTFDVEHVRAAAAAGQVDFGENRLQEAAGKVERAGSGLRWHLVGHLQSNKARKAAATFSYIHSIDNVDLLRRVDQAAAESQATPALLVQVDLAGEPTKHGARPEHLYDIFAAARQCRAGRVVGLMLLPPFFDDPEDARPYFRRLRTLRDNLEARGVPLPMLAELSMGMSHDFEVAVEEGATIVRVGTAIFGERQPRP
jgi:pyridoxal phosphate enzyme (YggS family)